MKAIDVHSNYQVIFDIALRWSADAERNRVLLTLHSSGVKPFYEETLIQSSSLSESWVPLDEGIILPRKMCAIDKPSGQEDLYGSSIAVAIHSLDPLECRNQFRLHLRKLGISIAEFAIARTIRLIAPYKEWWAGDLLSRSLFAPLIPPYNWLNLC